MKVRYSDVLAWVWGQRKMSQVLDALCCWISPCYGPFSLGTHFETCELFISVIFSLFVWVGGEGYKQQILNQQIWGHDCIS
jgi:hypothetical protein